MANKVYVGVSSKAREVNEIYVGVSSVARRVFRAYVGVNGVARLVYQSRWWLPNGFSTSNVIAAYRFKGAASETAALKDLTGNGYNLSKVGTVTWTAENGLYVAAGTEGQWSGVYNETIPGYTSAILRTYCSSYGSDLYSPSAGIVFAKQARNLMAGYTVDHQNGRYGSATVSNEAIVSASSNTVYSAGAAVSRYSNRTDWARPYTYPLIFGSSYRYSTVYVQEVAYYTPHMTLATYCRAVAFYSTSLTAAQHKELYNNIKAL